MIQKMIICEFPALLLKGAGKSLITASAFTSAFIAAAAFVSSVSAEKIAGSKHQHNYNHAVERAEKPALAFAVVFIVHKQYYKKQHKDFVLLHNFYSQ